MAYFWNGAAHRVRVEGRFVGRGQWLVHGVVSQPPDPFPGSTTAEISEARLELMIGVARESRRGRARGARSVHLVIDGDRALEGLFRVEPRLSGRAHPGTGLRRGEAAGVRAAGGAAAPPAARGPATP